MKTITLSVPDLAQKSILEIIAHIRPAWNIDETVTKVGYYLSDNSSFMCLVNELYTIFPSL